MKSGLVYLDRRQGSAHYADTLRSLGLRVQLTTLPVGDVAWLGRGCQTSVRVGVEIKTLGDLLHSIRTGRLAGNQLKGLVQSYQQVWLIVEGLYKVQFDGQLAIKSGKLWTARWFGRTGLTFGALNGFLTTLEVRANLHIRRTMAPRETARTIAALYGWWTSKDLDKHRSHRALHYEDLSDRALLAPLSETEDRKQRVAAALPGIGVDRAGAVAKHFGSIEAMMLADEREWRQVTGIGRTLAKRIVESIGAKRIVGSIGGG